MRTYVHEYPLSLEVGQLGEYQVSERYDNYKAYIDKTLRPVYALMREKRSGQHQIPKRNQAVRCTSSPMNWMIQENTTGRASSHRFPMSVSNPTKPYSVRTMAHIDLGNQASEAR